MSVLKSKRKESKLEVIIHSTKVHDMLIDFMQKDFGIKDFNRYVQTKYAYGDDDFENYSKYRYLLHNFKIRIDQTASMMTSNLRAANTTYPQSISEYETRRCYQNLAITNCEQIKKELQRIIEVFGGFDTFGVDINEFGPCVKAIEREIVLIKNWRQRDKRMKSYFEK